MFKSNRYIVRWRYNVFISRWHIIYVCIHKVRWKITVFAFKYTRTSIERVECLFSRSIHWQVSWTMSVRCSRSYSWSEHRMNIFNEVMNTMMTYAAIYICVCVERKRKSDCDITFGIKCRTNLISRWETIRYMKLYYYRLVITHSMFNRCWILSKD